MMKNLLTSSSKSLRDPVDYYYHRHRSDTLYRAFITRLLLTVITINTITAPSFYVTASITLLDPSSSSSSSPSHASYDSSNDPKYGRQLLNGYEYYSRLQYIPNNPSLCVQQQQQEGKPEVNYTITIPNDALPVSLLLTTTPTTDNENSTDCSLLEKIQNVLTHVEPIGRVRYLIVTTTEDDDYSRRIATDYDNNYVHVEGTLEEVFQIQTNGDNLIHIITLDELENHFNNNNNNNDHRIRSHSSTETSLHNSWMNKLNQFSKNLMESLRKRKKKKSSDADTDDQSDKKKKKKKKDDSHVDIPFYIIHISLSTQKDIYSYLQQYLLHNNNQFVNGGPQISIDTNRHGRHYYNHHNNNDPNQTILYMALVIFVAAGSCFIILLFCTNSDWDEDALNHLNNNQTNTTTRPTRQRLTKAQVREIYPIYRYDGQSKLYRIKVKQQQDLQSNTESTLTDPTVNSSNTSDTDTLRQPLLSTQEQQDMYEEEIIDNIQIDTCSICLDEYEVNDKLRIIPNCQHVYHSKCIGRWLSERSAVCPLCKVNLYIDQEVENDNTDNENINTNTNSDTNNTASTNNTNNNEEVVTPSISNDISTSIWHRVIERLYVSPSITTSTEQTININPIESTTIPDSEIPLSNQETNITTTATNSIPNDIEMSLSIDNNENARSSPTMTRSWWSRMFPSSTTTIRQQQQVDIDTTTNTTSSTMNMLTEPLLSSSSTSNVINNDTTVLMDVETAHPTAETVVTTPTTMNTISEHATDVVLDVESTFRPLSGNNATPAIDIVPSNNNSNVVHDSNNNSDNGDTGKDDDNNDNDTASIAIMDTTDPLAFPSSPIV